MLSSAIHRAHAAMCRMPAVRHLSVAWAPVQPNLALEERRSVTQLHKAAAAGRAFDVQALIERQVSDMYSSTRPTYLNALHIAAAHGHANIIALLLHRGFDPFKECTFEEAPTAFHIAIFNCHAEAVRAFTTHGCNPKAFSSKVPLLHLACRAPERAPKMVEYLLEAGADTLEQDSNGLTALNVASELLEKQPTEDRAAVVKLLSAS